MRAAWTGPAAAGHPASPSTEPDLGNPAGRSGGWSAPGPGEESRGMADKPQLIGPITWDSDNTEHPV